VIGYTAQQPRPEIGPTNAGSCQVPSDSPGPRPLSADLARFWGSGRRLPNCYGLTECGMASGAHLVTPDQAEPVAIGTALANATLLVLDEELQPLGRGGRRRPADRRPRSGPRLPG
jgi:hypothetical protein